MKLMRTNYKYMVQNALTKQFDMSIVDPIKDPSLGDKYSHLSVCAGCGGCRNVYN